MDIIYFTNNRSTMSGAALSPAKKVRTTNEENCSSCLVVRSNYRWRRGERERERERERGKSLILRFLFINGIFAVVFDGVAPSQSRRILLDSSACGIRVWSDRSHG